MLAAWIGGALILGFAANRIGVPPLVGFLIAGFAYSALGVEESTLLAELADVGVLLLLFAVGLKLRVKTLLRREVWGTALCHLAFVAAVGFFAVTAVGGFSWIAAVVLAVALGFSSTVFAAKVLEDQQELRAVHGRVAIGILVVQDLVAVALLAGMALSVPSPFAALLVLLPLARPLLSRLLDWAGHGELLVLFGVVLAVALGGYGFESLGLSSELGALLFGILLAEHQRAQELSNALWSVKEFFLVGFFLNIGLSGQPTLESFAYAALLLAFLAIKCAALFLSLIWLGFRARTSFLTTVSLATYSEFGLIVVQATVANGLIDAEWLVAAAIAVAASFLIAAPVNAHSHFIFGRVSKRLEQLERAERHPDDEPVMLGSAEILIVGMGRVGRAAYDFLHGQSGHVVGADSDPGKLERNLKEGRRVVYADAEDPSFWQLLNVDRLKVIMLTFPDVHATVTACKELRARDFDGLISATHVWEEDRERILKAGCDVTYNYYTEAGVGFARDSWDAAQAALRDSS